MAITKTVIDIYEDQALTVLNQTVTTNSDANPVTIGTLDAGTKYYATVKVTENGTESQASEVYPFYTYPDVYFSATPTASGTSITFSVLTSSTDVDIDQCGVVIAVDQYFSVNPAYYMSPHGIDGYQYTITGLLENQTYYIAPIVYDELGRIYQNPNYATVTTGTQPPTVVALSATNITPIAADITISIS